MNGYESDEAMAEALAGFESDESDEADYGEAPRRLNTRTFRPLPNLTPRPASGAGGTGNYVTQAQLQVVVAQVKALEGRVNTVNTNVTRMGNTISAAQKKETADRKKETDALRGEIRQVRELSALLPMLSGPQSKTLTETVGGLPAGTKVMVDSGDSLTTLLPLLLLSGSGSGGGLFGSGGGGGGGMDNSMLLVLLLAMRK